MKGCTPPGGSKGGWGGGGGGCDFGGARLPFQKGQRKIFVKTVDNQLQPVFAYAGKIKRKPPTIFLKERHRNRRIVLEETRAGDYCEGENINDDRFTQQQHFASPSKKRKMGHPGRELIRNNGRRGTQRGKRIR